MIVYHISWQMRPTMNTKSNLIVDVGNDLGTFKWLLHIRKMRPTESHTVRPKRLEYIRNSPDCLSVFPYLSQHYNLLPHHWSSVEWSKLKDWVHWWIPKPPPPWLLLSLLPPHQLLDFLLSPIRSLLNGLFKQPSFLSHSLVLFSVPVTLPCTVPLCPTPPPFALFISS